MRETAKNGYLNEADFVRSAIRNEILRYRIDEVRAEFRKHKNAVKAVRKLRKLTSQMSDEEYEAWVEQLLD